MRNKHTWPQVLAVVLALLLATVILACSGEEHKDIESYVTETDVIINECADLAIEVSNLYNNVASLTDSTIILRSTDYADQYDDLLYRFMAINCPIECLDYQEYCVNGITYSKQEVTEFGAYFLTGDIEHLYQSETYYNDGTRALQQANAERTRLLNAY